MTCILPVLISYGLHVNKILSNDVCIQAQSYACVNLRAFSNISRFSSQSTVSGQIGRNGLTALSHAVVVLGNVYVNAITLLLKMEG